MARPALYRGPQGATLELWPQRAAFDPAQSLLMVADAHFGKDHTFRRHGLPVPLGTEDEMVARLDSLLTLTRAAELVFLGDLLHGPWAQEAEALRVLAAWRARHPQLSVVLVEGNHDRHAGDPPASLGIHIVRGAWRRGPWALVHEPQVIPDAYALAGHEHPGVRLREGRGPGLRLPCFRMTPQFGVLPAFGGFTGLHVQAPLSDDQVFVVLESEGKVLPLHGEPVRTAPT